jgi:signal peptidase II
VDRPLHRRRAEARPLSVGQPEPARRAPDIRVGSSTNGLAPVSVAERPLGAGRMQWATLLSVVAAAIAADQTTKHIVGTSLYVGERVAVVGPFSIHHVQNSGIAFGLFASATSVVIVLTVLAVLWMISFFARSGARHPVLPVGLGLILGGSISNLVDRVRLGHVTDFLDFGPWPAFNLADSFIVAGVAVLVLTLLALDRPAAPRS